jgi:hypothetical protein
MKMKNQDMSKQKKNWEGVVVVGGILLGSLALLTLFPIGKTQANAPQYPKVINSDSVVFGRTFSEWSAAWEQWSYSIEVAQHPLFDNGDCSMGQSGPVWFLGGKFCANGATCSYTGVVRNCNVPLGKALYFPVVNGEDSALEESVAENPNNEAYQQIATLRAVEDAGMSTVKVYCWIDGAPIPQLQDRFRVQSVAFGFTLPNDNLLKAVYGNSSFTAGTYYPAVDDGWYVMLGQLPAGHHIVHFGGGNANFALDVTYNLHVK